MLTELDIEIYLAVTSFLLILLIDFTMSSNLVQAIVCLIFSYLLVATHFMLFNAGYLAIVLILVYVGAISVLFLWLLMTIEEVEYINDNKKFIETVRPFESGTLFWWFVVSTLFVLSLAGFIYESFDFFSSHFSTLFNEPHFIWSKNDFELNDRSVDWVSMLFSSETVRILGMLLYSNFFFILRLLTILRLVTLLGGIIIIRQLDSSDLLK